MEPLAAISLAGSVIQFVDFGAKLLSEAHEIYHSKDGTTTERIELAKIAESLEHLSASMSPPKDYPDDEFREIVSSAQGVARELIDVLQKIKGSNASKRHWQSLRQALSTLGNRDKIEGLHKRLKSLRSQLSLHVLKHIRYVYHLC